MRPRPDMVLALLQAGMRAPSADNRHTLRFAWRGDTLQVLSTDAPSWAELPSRNGRPPRRAPIHSRPTSRRATPTGVSTSVGG